MSPVSLGLDGLLILLLLTAVAVGVRLNRKLKDLKDSQSGFIKAVGELDAAAMRAESGLAALRDATTDAHDQLLTRIESARGLVARLDRVLPETETAAAEARSAAEAANVAAEAARRAAALRPAAPPRAVATADDVVVALHPRTPSDSALQAPLASDEAAAERAATLFLQERALRLGAAPGFAAEPDAEFEPVSRLARFKARRSGTRS